MDLNSVSYLVINGKTRTSVNKQRCQCYAALFRTRFNNSIANDENESFCQTKASDFAFFPKHLCKKLAKEDKHEFGGDSSASLNFQNNQKNNQNKRKSIGLQTWQNVLMIPVETIHNI